MKVEALRVIEINRCINVETYDSWLRVGLPQNAVNLPQICSKHLLSFKLTYVYLNANGHID